MQAFNIGRMFAGTKVNTEMFDISAHLDRTLHYGENLRNVQSQMGITTRNFGLEQQERERHEKTRERVQRQDPQRQTGRWQGEHNLMLDRMLHAQRPGKRFSRSGHRYYERRANRSDKNPSSGL